MGKPLVVPGVPGMYVAWGSPAIAVPPTREPGDPPAGNEILGVDCISYLGSGGDVGATGVWDSRQSINWAPVRQLPQQGRGPQSHPDRTGRLSRSPSF